MQNILASLTKLLLEPEKVHRRPYDDLRCPHEWPDVFTIRAKFENFYQRVSILCQPRDSVTPALIPYIAPFTDINGLFTAVPEIMISESKWSFLYNGASLCLRSIYRLKHIIEVTCLNGQPASAGRYMTLMLRRTPIVNILQRIQKRFWKIQLNRAESKYSLLQIGRVIRI